MASSLGNSGKLGNSGVYFGDWNVENPWSKSAVDPSLIVLLGW
jgi:hypothetical protein